MTITRSAYSFAALLAVSAGIFSQAALADNLPPAIEKSNSDFVAAIAKGDAAAVAALYGADAQVMPPGSDPLTGPDIQKYWQSSFAAGVSGATFKTLDVFGQGLTVTEVGLYQLRNKDNKQLDHGKYIVVWHKEGGKWKLLRDMFSSNEPPAKK